MKAMDQKEEGKRMASGPGPEEAESAAAWEQIENGRYRARRIRGSCRGRELG